MTDKSAMETRDSSAVRGDRIEQLEALLREVIDLPLISNDGINLKYRIKAVLAVGKDATQAVQSGPDVAGATPAVAAPSEEKFIDPITKAFIDGWVACKNNPDPGPLELYELACAYKGDEYVASRESIIEEVALAIQNAELTYGGPDPIGARQLRTLTVMAIRAMKRTVSQDGQPK